MKISLRNLLLAISAVCTVAYLFKLFALSNATKHGEACVTTTIVNSAIYLDWISPEPFSGNGWITVSAMNADGSMYRTCANQFRYSWYADGKFNYTKIVLVPTDNRSIRNFQSSEGVIVINSLSKSCDTLITINDFIDHASMPKELYGLQITIYNQECFIDGKSFLCKVTIQI